MAQDRGSRLDTGTQSSAIAGWQRRGRLRPLVLGIASFTLLPFCSAASFAQSNQLWDLGDGFAAGRILNSKDSDGHEEGLGYFGGAYVRDVNKTFVIVPGRWTMEKDPWFSFLAFEEPGVPDASGASTNISRDATTAIGYLDDGFDTPYNGFLWTQANGVVDLGTLDPGNSNAFSTATDVSDDDSVVVGFSDFNDGTTQHAFTWTQAGGIVDLGSGNGATGFSRGFGVSGNGNAVVGDSDFPSGPRSAYLWTATGGFENLGSINAAPSVATAITDDASVAVGQAGLGSDNSAAFRWTQAGGLVNIGGILNGDADAAATAVSDNGKIVVGISAPRPLTLGNLGYDWGTDTHAFRWTQATGTQDLAALLSAAGVNMAGITLVAVTGISPDGQFIAGQMTTPSTAPNVTVPFIAQYCDDNIGAACVLLQLVATPASGQAPLAVAFRATDLALPATYTLNFGDGTKGPVTTGGCVGPVGGQGGIQCSGTGSHTYSSAGTYTATLLNASGDTLGDVTITVGGNVVRPLKPPLAPRGLSSPPVAISTPTPERHSLDQ